MALNLIKLCVGCDSVKDLRAWIREKLQEKKRRKLPLEHWHDALARQPDDIKVVIEFA